MSDRSDLAKLESILEYINDINKIVERHNTIENALLDFEGQYAVLMCIQQIGELVKKIENSEYQSKIPVKNIVGFRNVITHNYSGINFQVTEKIISENIPELKNTIVEILKEKSLKENN
ncbi:MAG: DUF86 domain-containing protein [Candidatus Cloacimonetes bacterium]|nr:DUF86 domain-containing protein [Candidatus Cloacimonadota bacterium]